MENGIPVCVRNRTPVSLDPNSSLAQGLDSPLATLKVFEGTVGNTGQRVQFAAEARQMALLEPADPTDDHPHIVIADWQVIARYNAN